MSRLPVVALLAVLVALAGCGALSEPTGPGDQPTPLDDTGGSPPSIDVDVSVTAVVDGDTIRIAHANGTVDTVRLVGVDTPEVHVEVQPTEYEGIPDTEAGRSCLRAAGENASDAMRSWVGDETVTLQFDPEADTRGGYGRLLGYVLVDGENVNYDLLTTGHARLYDSAFTQRDRFADAESEARAAGRGLWRCAG